MLMIKTWDLGYLKLMTIILSLICTLASSISIIIFSVTGSTTMVMVFCSSIIIFIWCPTFTVEDVARQ